MSVSMSEPFGDEERESGVGLEDQVREPRRFKVLLHNDHYTTMEFVVAVLMKVFNRTEAEATQIMLNIHNNGVGLCGVYTAEVAELKVAMVLKMARNNGYPLKCSMEEV